MPLFREEERSLIVQSSERRLLAVALPGLWFLSPVRRRVAFLCTRDNAASVSPDGRWVLFTRVEQFGSNLVPLDGIH